MDALKVGAGGNVVKVVDDGVIKCDSCGSPFKKGDWLIQAHKFEGRRSTGIIGEAPVVAVSEVGAVHVNCPEASDDQAD